MSFETVRFISVLIVSNILTGVFVFFLAKTHLPTKVQREVKVIDNCSLASRIQKDFGLKIIKRSIPTDNIQATYVENDLNEDYSYTMKPLHIQKYLENRVTKSGTPNRLITVPSFKEPKSRIEACLLNYDKKSPVIRCDWDIVKMSITGITETKLFKSRLEKLELSNLTKIIKSEELEKEDLLLYEGARISKLVDQGILTRKYNLGVKKYVMNVNIAYVNNSIVSTTYNNPICCILPDTIKAENTVCCAKTVTGGVFTIAKNHFVNSTHLSEKLLAYYNEHNEDLCAVLGKSVDCSVFWSYGCFQDKNICENINDPSILWVRVLMGKYIF